MSFIFLLIIIILRLFNIYFEEFIKLPEVKFYNLREEDLFKKEILRFVIYKLLQLKPHRLII